jgi:hypothetical protein
MPAYDSFMPLTAFHAFGGSGTDPSISCASGMILASLSLSLSLSPLDSRCWLIPSSYPPFLTLPLSAFNLFSVAVGSLSAGLEASSSFTCVNPGASSQPSAGT